MPRTTPKLPLASTGGKLTIPIADAVWCRIETAYGGKLSAKVRKSMHEATESFIEWEEFERKAEPLSKPKDHLVLLRKAASQLQEKMMGGGLGVDSRVYANHFIKKHFHDHHLPNGDCLQQISSILGSFVVACDLGLKDIGSPETSGFRKGDCWEQWIRRLTSIAKENDLLYGVRNDSDKRKGDAPSPFVTLVREFQACLPEECRRPYHSDDALGKAIHRARQASQRDR
jgi:hypothetical protein